MSCCLFFSNDLEICSCVITNLYECLLIHIYCTQLENNINNVISSNMMPGRASTGNVQIYWTQTSSILPDSAKESKTIFRYCSRSQFSTPVQ